MKPSISNLRARPPKSLFFSSKVTSKPFCAKVVAAYNPANPAPITITFFLVDTDFSPRYCHPVLRHGISLLLAVLIREMQCRGTA